MIRSLLASITLVLLGACTEYAATADSAPPRGSIAQAYDGPWRIDEVDWVCTEGDSDRWSFEVRTEGWAEQVNLRVGAPTEQDTGTESLASVETHPLENVDWGEEGSWDAWELVLLAVSDATEVQSGATTRWGCEHAPAEGGSLAWMATMYRAGHPGEPADCAVWGARAAEVFRADCQCLDADGDCTN